ncbi:Aste57867_25044 [Aphanomyces stellatus]|uniref:Lon protease homolog n=1 Tax=Aphanomyces stellatus TaxID=120398 RepID=A0A485LSZ0_9STRA|nr:hypothetical protein As57867_024966 [Aphanomyces stellatus]VFU01675.1 Aste57867_25044 [Aphanomyces stellatus]
METLAQSTLPILTIRDSVLFPGAYMRIAVGRESSLRLVQESLWDDFHRSLEDSQVMPVLLGVFTEHGVKDKYALGQVGTVARIIQLQRSRSNQTFEYSMLIQALARISLVEVLQAEPFITAKVQLEKDTYDGKPKLPLKQLISQVTSGLALGKSMQLIVPRFQDDPQIARKLSVWLDMLAAHIQAPPAEKQMVLNAVNVIHRLELLWAMLQHQKKTIKPQAMTAAAASALQHAPHDDGVSEDDEIRALEKKIHALKPHLSDETFLMVQREHKRLKRMNANQPEHHVILQYLDFFCALPWVPPAEHAPLDLATVQAQLNKDHYGMQKVKSRLVEYMAVRNLTMHQRTRTKGLILCLVGPPGVGKTSLAQSIATAMNRTLQRLALGGVSDESEIRGHRKTYIGAMPGNVLLALRRAQVSNPLVVLDEIDKLGVKGYNNNAVANALLEVLDPQQNDTFKDHYLNVPFDLSHVMFVATANSLDTIPRPLLDRMEIVHIEGYTGAEKLAIAEQYIVPRQIQDHGLTAPLEFTPDALKYMIGHYTQEAGVRDLQRKIGSICRHIAVQVVNDDAPAETITVDLVQQILGKETVHNDVALRAGIPGVSTGLAWSTVGGSILFVEASVVKDMDAPPSSSEMKLTLTGTLGDCMKESAQLAVTWLKVHLPVLAQIDLKQVSEFHIHFPEGATPKDGPSAGIAIVSALVSVVTDRVVPIDLAMTGEITLRGVVLPVGGITQKVHAAARAGIKRVLLPLGNKKDGDLVAPSVPCVEIIYVQTIVDVLRVVFGLGAADEANVVSSRL